MVAFTKKLSTSVLTFETTPQIRFAFSLTIQLADDVLISKTLFQLLPSRKEADVAEPAAGACAWCTETRGRGSPLQGYSNETLLRPIPESPKSILNFSIFSVLRFSRLRCANIRDLPKEIQ